MISKGKEIIRLLGKKYTYSMLRSLEKSPKRFKAMSDAGRCPIIACGQDPLVFHDDGADRPPPAGGTFGYQQRDIHKISFP